MRASLFAWMAWAGALIGAVCAVLQGLGVAAIAWWVPALVACLAALVLAALAALNAKSLAVENEQAHERLSHAQTDNARLLHDLQSAQSRAQKADQRANKAEQQLLATQQHAEAAVLAKGEFLATMSHELRTPINGILPMLQLLGSAPLSPEQRGMLATAQSSAQSMLRIVDDILDYSKLEANKVELETTVFNLRDVMESVLVLLQRPAENKRLTMQLEVDPSVRLSVRGDPVRLRQVLSNLVGNAVKFTERGGVVLAVRRLGENASQHQFRFEVRDTGIGIDREAQQKLFSSFTQADASTTRLYGGTGLGLSISKRIVDLMNGRIGVESEPGKGSLFWFEIPLLKVVGDLQVNAISMPQMPRALLVAPGQRLQLRLGYLLPVWGLQMVVVDSAHEAAEQLRNQRDVEAPYAFIIADLTVMSGQSRPLHRAFLQRPAALAPTRLVWVHGKDPIPADLMDVTPEGGGEGIAGSIIALHQELPDADVRAIFSASAFTTPQTAESVIEATNARPILGMVEPERVPLAELPPLQPVVPPAPPAPAPPRPATPAIDPIAAELASALAAARLDPNSLSDLPKPTPGLAPTIAAPRPRPVQEPKREPARFVIGDGPATAALPPQSKAAAAAESDTEPKLLLVEDNPVNMAVAKALLNSLGHTCDHAGNGKIALDKMRAHRYQLVLMDCQMPVLDGYAASRQWREYEAKSGEPRLPIIAITANAMMGDRQNCTDAGMDDYLTKPVSRDQLEAILGRWLATPSTASPEPKTETAAVTEPAPSPEPSPHNSSGPVLDRSVLDDLQEIVGAEVARIIRLFLDDAPRLIAQLEDASNGAGDMEALRSAAHTLKSSSANVGALALSEAAKRVELGARAGSLEYPTAAVARIIAEFARARMALQLHLSQVARAAPTEI